MTSELDNTQVKSRAELREKRMEEKEDHSKPKREKKIRIRILPIWLRLIIVSVLLVLSAGIGVVVGYGIIGDGNPGDALKKSTWQHIIDLVEKDIIK